MRLLPLLLCAAILEAVAQNTTTSIGSTAGLTTVSSTPMTTNSTSSLSSSTANIATNPATRSTLVTVRATPPAPAVTSPTPVRLTPDPANKVMRRLEVIDIDLLLTNKRIMTCYVRCFVGKGPCTPEARDFKKLLPRILSTGCGYCTPSQRKVIKKIFLYMYKERYSDFKLLQLKFDPKCKFENKVMGLMGVETGKKPTEPNKPTVT